MALYLIGRTPADSLEEATDIYFTRYPQYVGTTHFEYHIQHADGGQLTTAEAGRIGRLLDSKRRRGKHANPKLVGHHASTLGAAVVESNARTVPGYVKVTFAQARLLRTRHPGIAILASLDTTDKGSARSLAKRWYRWFVPKTYATGTKSLAARAARANPATKATKAKHARLLAEGRFEDAARTHRRSLAAQRKNPDLFDYRTGGHIRKATSTEHRASKAAAKRDGGSGVILVGGRSTFVNPAKRLTREEFERRYWGAEAHTVPAMTRREFYSDYRESGQSFAAYKKATSQPYPNPRFKRTRAKTLPLSEREAQRIRIEGKLATANLAPISRLSPIRTYKGDRKHRNPSFSDYARAGARAAATAGARAAAHVQRAADDARARAEKEASRRQCDPPTVRQALEVLAKAHGVKVNPYGRKKGKR